MAGNRSPSVELQVGSSFNPAASLLRQLRSAITPDDSERSADEGFNLVHSAATGSVNLLAGEIRHLSPDLKLDWPREVHVLILKVDESRGRVLAVPFGPLSVPAFESELASELADDSLAVLCLWNATWIATEQAARSWLVTKVDEGLLRDCHELRAALASRETPPSHLAERIGPPMLHPQDARQAYVNAEENLLENLQDLL
jgi:hypothetical protein